MRVGELAVICGSIFDDAAKAKPERRKPCRSGLYPWPSGHFGAPGHRGGKGGGSATGRPTPLLVKRTVEQSCRWSTGPRSTHSWDGWTKNGRRGRLYHGPTAGFRQGPGPHTHRKQRQGVRRPQSCVESTRRTILLRQTVSFLGPGVERAHQRPGAGVLPKRNGFSQGIGRRGPEGTGSAQRAPRESLGIPDTHRGNIRSRLETALIIGVKYLRSTVQQALFASRWLTVA